MVKEKERGDIESRKRESPSVHIPGVLTMTAEVVIRWHALCLLHMTRFSFR